jgi:hypothetical protein
VVPEAVFQVTIRVYRILHLQLYALELAEGAEELIMVQAATVVLD